MKIVSKKLSDCRNHNANPCENLSGLRSSKQTYQSASSPTYDEWLLVTCAVADLTRKKLLARLNEIPPTIESTDDAAVPGGYGRFVITELLRNYTVDLLNSLAYSLTSFIIINMTTQNVKSTMNMRIANRKNSAVQYGNGMGFRKGF